MMADEWRVTEATPQLVVAPGKAYEALLFYQQLFGAQHTRYTHYPKEIPPDSNKYTQVACYEFTIGSTTLVVRDYDSTNSGCANLSQPVITCIRVQCSNLDLLMARALYMGCVSVKEVMEDPLRPGVLVGVVRDPFSHTWELSDKTNGASEDGFMGTEDMNAILQDWTESQREGYQCMVESYDSTPRVSCTIEENAVDVYARCNDQFKKQLPIHFDPIILDCKYTLVPEMLRNDLKYRGTIVGLASPPTEMRRRDAFVEKGGDFVLEKPLNLKKITKILFESLKKKKKVANERKDQ